MAAVIKGKWTARQYEPHARHRGRAAGTTAGSWVDDLVSLKKAICLCDTCKRNFNPAASGYKRVQAVPGYNYVKGQCDGCKQQLDCNVYLPKERAL